MSRKVLTSEQIDVLIQTSGQFAKDLNHLDEVALAKHVSFVIDLFGQTRKSFEMPPGIGPAAFDKLEKKIRDLTGLELSEDLSGYGINKEELSELEPKDSEAIRKFLEEKSEIISGIKAGFLKEAFGDELSILQPRYNIIFTAAGENVKEELCKDLQSLLASTEELVIPERDDTWIEFVRTHLEKGQNQRASDDVIMALSENAELRTHFVQALRDESLKHFPRQAHEGINKYYQSLPPREASL